MPGFELESNWLVIFLVASFSTPKFQVEPPEMIIEGDQLHIKCIVQVTHLVREFPEIIIQKDKAIVATSKQGSEAVYSVMAMVEHSGHYICKVESNRISKTSSIMVNITGRNAEGLAGGRPVLKTQLWLGIVPHVYNASIWEG